MHYLLAAREFINRTLSAILPVGSVWLMSWAIRRRGGFDYPADLTARAVRWIAVFLPIGLVVNFPGSMTASARVALYLASLAFLVWPNFAYQLTWLLRRVRILPPGQPPHDPYIKRMGFWGPEY